MRLDPRVDDHRTLTAPVLVVSKRLDSVNVVRWIGSGERSPEEVVQVLGGEVAVIDQQNHGKALQPSAYGSSPCASCAACCSPELDPCIRGLVMAMIPG